LHGKGGDATQVALGVRLERLQVHLFGVEMGLVWFH
jgi:hypothetical protein